MKKVLFCIILVFTINSSAQKQANYWFFGQNAALDFSSGTPLPFGSATDNQLSTREGCSSFADIDGNLLFYVGATNPFATNLTIWNRNNEPMPFSDVANGGQPLQGDASSSQSALTIPAPGMPDIYYLFTVGAQSSTNAGFWFYTIDMTQDGGLGDIVGTEVALNPATVPQSEWTEKVTAVRGDECDTFWVISYSGGDFYSYRVSSSGVDTTNPIRSRLDNSSYNNSSFIGIFLNELDPRGYLKVSPDGTKLVAANMTSGIYLFDFDDVTGRVSNPRELLVDGNDAYGVEFSPSSQVLYVSTGGAGANTTENLYQYDLTQNNISDINNSRFTIFSYANTRGALQLGPDNKIYWASNESNNISVINNPESLGTGSNFSHQSVSVGPGRLSTEGLPPFLSSLLLPVEIRDEDTNAIVNNQTLQSCVGDAKTINPEVITGSNITYEWSFDDGTSTAIVSNTSSLALTNVSLADFGTYLLTITLTDDCGIVTRLEAEFSLEVFELASATQPDDILFCDSDNDGFNTFDLSTTIRNSTILNGLDPATFEVLYFDNPADANANTNALTVPYTNPSPFSTQTIYARVNNRNEASICFAITSFILDVTNLVLTVSPSDYEICDDTNDGNDTNGFVDRFILSDKDAEILSLNGLDPSIHEVSYHLDANDAINDVNPIDKINPYTNIIAGSQPIFIRVENTVDLCEDASQTFNLVVNPLPIIDANVELRQCDNDTDGFSDFNLNEAASDISTDFTNETFRFYPTLNDAENDTNEITNTTVFTNRTVTTDTVWARAITSFGCYRIAEVLLTVSTTGIPLSFQRSFTACDDFLDIDGNDSVNNNDTDGVTSFDFSSVTAEVRALFPVTQQLIITYYRNEADALAEQNTILDIANYRNIGYPNTQQIYIRVDSQLDNDCLGFGPFITLNVDPVPEANPVNNLELCDDDADGDGFNGFVQSFNLDSQTATILGTQDPANFTVTYHTSANDARSGTNAIATIAAYTNISADLQTIFVRVTNNTTACFTDHTTFDLIVNPLPIANPAPNIEVCDDDSDGSAQNGFSQSFDLESQTATILGAQDPTQFSVTYHATLSDAQLGVLPLGSLFSNTVPDVQTIYVRVFNAATQCANGISTFDVIVNSEPITENISNLSYCDEDSDGDDTNGFVQNIDLDGQINAILGPLQDPANFTVTFHENQSDATSGINSLISPYTNTIANQQTIYVRVLNNTTTCVNDDFTFDVVVDPLPNFKVTSPQIVCLNGPVLTIGPENATAVYDYVWTDPSGNNIISENINISSGGLYTVTATTTDGTSCSRTREIQVDESIIATLTQEDVTIVDDSENNSITIDPTSLGIGDYEYALVDENDNFIRNYQDDPFFENLGGGFYVVLVRDKNGCGTASFLVSVIEFPKFFTPNNDGLNDTWAIKGADSRFFPNSQVYIFNRFGKVVAEIDIDGDGWDGTFNSNLLPSDDYWFDINLISPNGVLINRKGNFSLLRK